MTPPMHTPTSPTIVAIRSAKVASPTNPHPSRPATFAERKVTLLLTLFLLACSTTLPTAQAQLFGQRNLGQTLTRGTSPGAPTTGAASSMSGITGANNTVGSIKGAERFLRGNRNPNAFVGSDRVDASFVGSEQALGTGNVRAATESLQELGAKRGAKNPPIPPLPKKGQYYPRLVLDDSFYELPPENTLRPQSGINQAPSHIVALQRRIQEQSRGQAQLELINGQAKLTGTVPDQRTRERLAWLASFEPGIDRVINELRLPSE